MAESLVTDEFWNEIKPILPSHPVNPRGGAPRKPDRNCLEGILHVLRTGCQWKRLPRTTLWPSGSTCWRRFTDWTKVGVWPQLHRRLLNQLGMAGAVNIDRVIVDSASVRAKQGGVHTGPSPVDRAKNGCKRHIITDACGVPLLIECTPANIRDDVPFLAMLDSTPAVKMPGRGPARYKPGAVVGDAGYGFLHIVRQVVERRIMPMLAPRAQRGRTEPVVHGSGLGKVRYVVERTIAWLANFRRITQCYERTGAAWQAFNELACCVLCANKLRNLQVMKMAA